MNDQPPIRRARRAPSPSSVPPARGDKAVWRGRRRPGDRPGGRKDRPTGSAPRLLDRRPVLGDVGESYESPAGLGKDDGRDRSHAFLNRLRVVPDDAVTAGAGSVVGEKAL